MPDSGAEEADFDFRRELKALYRTADGFEEKLKALTLMEKVGGFVAAVKPGQEEGGRDLSKPDPMARRVLDRINGQSA